MAVTAGIVLNIFELVGQVGAFMYDNWSVLEPLVMGVAVALALYAGYLAATEAAELASAAAKTVLILAEYAHAAATGTAVAATTAETAAQMGLNTALLACPVTWIVLAIVAFVAVLMAASQWDCESHRCGTDRLWSYFRRCGGCDGFYRKPRNSNDQSGHYMVC